MQVSGVLSIGEIERLQNEQNTLQGIMSDSSTELNAKVYAQMAARLERVQALLKEGDESPTSVTYAVLNPRRSPPVPMGHLASEVLVSARKSAVTPKKAPALPARKSAAAAALALATVSTAAAVGKTPPGQLHGAEVGNGLWHAGDIFQRVLTRAVGPTRAQRDINAKKLEEEMLAKRKVNIPFLKKQIEQLERNKAQISRQMNNFLDSANAIKEKLLERFHAKIKLDSEFMRLHTEAYRWGVKYYQASIDVIDEEVRILNLRVIGFPVGEVIACYGDLEKGKVMVGRYFQRMSQYYSTLISYSTANGMLALLEGPAPTAKAAARSGGKEKATAKVTRKSSRTPKPTPKVAARSGGKGKAKRQASVKSKRGKPVEAVQASINGVVTKKKRK